MQKSVGDKHFTRSSDDQMNDATIFIFSSLKNIMG